jgi:D-alanyl-D-alanine carboxypeptidase
VGALGLEHHVINPASYTLMRSQVLLRGGERSPYGFGFFLAELEGHPRVEHGGRIEGFTGFLAYYLDADLYIAVLANTGSPVPESLSEQLARIVLGIPEAEPKDPAH